MSQINRYRVQQVSPGQDQELSLKDTNLIPSFSLGNVPFLLDKYELKADLYDLGGAYLETVSDLKTYTVLGINQGNSATKIAVDPVQDALDNGYLGDIRVDYKVTNNVFSPSSDQDSKAILFIREISLDRTEIRATSTTISEVDLQTYAQQLYHKLNDQAYFSGVNLDFIDDNISSWCINVMTEVLDGDLVVTFKLYEPLPKEATVKSRFTVEEQIGGISSFQVTRTVEVVEEEQDYRNQLKGPNFNVELLDNLPETVTDYLNYQELFSYPEANSRSELYSIYKQQGIELSIDHSDLANFVHFSSAAERLENFRYKLTLLKEYESVLGQEENEAVLEKYKRLYQGIIDNFDHYDRYLYYENADGSWPKSGSTKPYENLDPESEEAKAWFEEALSRAQDYDEHNPDILINTIPLAIRQDSRNDPYLIFIHMIGQHFDDEWVYAKAISDRYSGDNRLNFGLSKDLVREALRGFGVEMVTTNQNLEALFELCVPGKTYNTGSEFSVTDFEQIDSVDQPVFVEDYRKEIYKRIYHNLPLLLKTKGTARGLRALVSCFGIPEDLLEISVQGSARFDLPFFGPEHQTTSSLGRIRLDNTGSQASQMFQVSGSTGRFIPGTTLSEVGNILQKENQYSAGTHEVELGFRLNKQFDDYVKSHVSASFDYDNLVGDPGNFEENYGEAFANIYNQFMQDLWGDPVFHNSTTGLFRSPSAIIRLVRYFDSALFRTVQSFVPARDNIVAGVIVDDNILHRNRYKGVRPDGAQGSEFVGKWTKQGVLEQKWAEELTGSIETVFIDGGEAGCLKVLKGRKVSGSTPVQNIYLKAISPSTQRTFVTISHAYPSVNYSESQAIGSKYVLKTIFDDSPKFNGELSGTVEEVTDGELTAGNRFRKGGSSTKELTYVLDLRYLCLPKHPVDTVLNVVATTSGYLGDIRSLGQINYGINGRDISLSEDKQHVIVLVPNKEHSIGTNEEIADSFFVGWYVGTSSLGLGSNYLNKISEGEISCLGSTSELSIKSADINTICSQFENRYLLGRYIERPFVNCISTRPEGEGVSIHVVNLDGQEVSEPITGRADQNLRCKYLYIYTDKVGEGQCYSYDLERGETEIYEEEWVGKYRDVDVGQIIGLGLVNGDETETVILEGNSGIFYAFNLSNEGKEIALYPEGWPITI